MNGCQCQIGRDFQSEGRGSGGAGSVAGACAVEGAAVLKPNIDSGTRRFPKIPAFL